MSLRGIEFINENEEYISDEDKQEIKVENLSEMEDEKVEIKKEYTAKCGEIFISNSGKMHFICSFCDLNFTNTEYFQNHLFKQHLDLVKDEKYGNSDVSMSLEGDTNYGLTTHESDNDNSSSTQRASPISRNTTHATSETQGTKDSCFYCDICDKKFKTKRGMINHNMVRHGAITSTEDVMVSEYHDSEDEVSNAKTLVKTVKNPRQCSFCGKQLRSIAERVGHERTHNGEKPYKCKECGNNFRLKSQLDSHMRTHTGERPFLCPHCPAKFSNSANRSIHVRAHLGIKNFSCELCNKAFVTNRELTVHIRSHTGEKPYQCELCGASYTTSSKLREHKKRHTNTKPYKCNICSRCFYSMTLLKGHQVTHSDKRPFACNLCDARFPLKRGLRCHMKIHSAVKEYVCNICGKAFSQNSGLYCHMRTHGHKPGVKTEEVEYVMD